MKLNYKRTMLVGLAFLSISAFWQMYDSVIPLILTKTFHLNETISGGIMAADNILALFLLPIFGSLSDRTNTRIGKRKPFIIFGTIIAVAALLVLPYFDNGFYANPSNGKLIGFICTLAILLIAMGTYRSPAVALMPDVTPKPLRSKGNAVINLMGAIGGIMYLAVAAIMYPNSKVNGLPHVNYEPLFMVVAVIMVASVVILCITINEPKLTKENQELEASHPEWNLAEDDGSGNEVLPPAVKRSLGFLLASIALWFIAYNGVTTWFTTYVDKMMGQGIGGASFCLLIATGVAIVAFIPIGNLSSRLGRKKVIRMGTILLAAGFLAGYFLTTTMKEINFTLYIAFGVVGIAWAAINVNSLPMVVEMCKGSDIGKFTGYYYTASMAAQIVTPILAGSLLRNISYSILFPYATVFAILSFITMGFVKHGDAKPEAVGGLEAFEDLD